MPTGLSLPKLRVPLPGETTKSGADCRKVVRCTMQLDAWKDVETNKRAAGRLRGVRVALQSFCRCGFRGILQNESGPGHREEHQRRAPLQRTPKKPQLQPFSPHLYLSAARWGFRRKHFPRALIRGHNSLKTVKALIYVSCQDSGRVLCILHCDRQRGVVLRRGWHACRQ